MVTNVLIKERIFVFLFVEEETGSHTDRQSPQCQCWSDVSCGCCVDDDDANRLIRPGPV